MTYDPERYDAPSYEGEVIEQPTRLRPRTWVAIGALGTGTVLVLTETWWPLILLICLYVAGMFVRDKLRRRSRDRAWNDIATNVMEGTDR
jgi:hypothetical protein